MEVDSEEAAQRRRYHWTALLFVHFFFCSFTICVGGARATLHASSDVNSTVADSDLAALLAMKTAFIDHKGILQSWSTSTGGACTGRWVGVKCYAGRVIGIHLPSKSLGGQLATEVGQLSSLRQLSLHTNAIAGPIPGSLSALHNLRGLYLFHNLFTGSIPSSLSPVLQALDLSENRLSGSIPTSLASSALLRRIYLSYNNLSSGIPSSFASLSRLQELRLGHNLLAGAIPNLSQLSNLQTLDLSYNLLTGSFPSLVPPPATLSLTKAVAHLTTQSKAPFPSLLTLNLSHNALTGTLPTQIGELSMLLLLDLSYNKFRGQIPSQIANITELSALDVSHNNFSGTLPSSLATLKNLTKFNCSFNSLTGATPKFRHPFQASAFVENRGLCGYSSSAPCSPSSAPAPKKGTGNATQEAEAASAGEKRKKFSVLSVVFLVVGVVVLLLLVMCVCSLLFICCCRRSGAAAMAKAGFAGEKEGGAAGGVEGAKKEGEVGGKLVHFEGSLGFAADDLLCATAEVVGKSTYGTVYKATLEDGNQVAVKRLREGIVKSQRDFEVEVTALGAIRHPNLLALRAYYWGPKDEKLLIFDFMQGGSLAAFVHARGPETPLTWQTRMNIAVGSARGLVYLHDEIKIIHGNLTSSNILIDAHQNAKLSDFGLARLMTPAANSNVIATAGALGYRAPELTKLRKATTKSDVYSFGIVLLELLTGKAPGEGPSSGAAAEGTLDLPEWVASIVQQQWTQEVFDVELMKGRAPGDEELINTLQLAMACVKLGPLERPEMSEVLRQLEQIKPDLKQ